MDFLPSRWNTGSHRRVWILALVTIVVVLTMAIGTRAQAHEPWVAYAWGQNAEGTLGNGGGSSRDVPVAVSNLSGVTQIASERGWEFYGQALALLENATVMGWGRNRNGEVGDGTTETKNYAAAVCAVGEKAPCAKHLSGVTAIAAGALHSVAALQAGTVAEWGKSGDGAESTVPVAKPGLSEVKAVEAGEEYSLALLKNGTVVAWGQNVSGQLGGGTASESKEPVAVCAVGEKAPCAKSLSSVKAIAAGAHQSLALLENGTVVAWGENSSGQLGNGSETSSTVPVVVCAVGAKAPCSGEGQQLKGARAIAGGQVHSMALLENGTVVDWGANSGGQLGIATTEKSSTPVVVCAVGEPEKIERVETAPCTNHLSGVTAIAAGGERPDASYALLESGEMRSWGDGRWHELGDGSTETKSVPVAVCAVGEAEKIATIDKSPCPNHLSDVKGIAGGDEQGFAFGPPPPTVAAVSPREGSKTGGTTVTITGADFEEATAVKFGSSNAASFKVNSEGSITAISPSGSGIVDVTVTTPAGTSPASSSDQFTYSPLAPGAPTVSAVVPNGGPQTGNTPVTITGTHLEYATAVRFGSSEASYFKATSDRSITAVAPAGTGTVDITVTNYSDTSPTSSADRFTYESLRPIVTGMIPKEGSPSGGTSVTITGAAFTATSAVKFGSTNATSFTVNSDSSITAVSPPGTGTVDVTVTTSTGTTATTPADQFSYIALPPPTVTGLNPKGGPPTGGTAVTITGTNFLHAWAVNFGWTPATSFTVVSDSTIVALSPKEEHSLVGPPAVSDVTVTTPGGRSAYSSADWFTYGWPCYEGLSRGVTLACVP